MIFIDLKYMIRYLSSRHKPNAPETGLPGQLIKMEYKYHKQPVRLT